MKNAVREKNVVLHVICSRGVTRYLRHKYDVKPYNIKVYGLSERAHNTRFSLSDCILGCANTTDCASLIRGYENIVFQTIALYSNIRLFFTAWQVAVFTFFVNSLIQH